MNSATTTDWIFVVFIFGLMSLSAYLLGVQMGQLIFRLKNWRKCADYDKWGVATDLFRPLSHIWFAAWMIFFVASTAFMLLMAFAFTALVDNGSTSISDRLYYTTTFAIYAWFIGLISEANRIGNIRIMTMKLEDLPEAFHCRFMATELISMYEGLRHAPEIFWKEYSNLPVERINRETNRDYRELASLYRDKQLIRHNRILIVVGIVAFIIAAIPTVLDLLK